MLLQKSHYLAYKMLGDSDPNAIKGIRDKYFVAINILLFPDCNKKDLQPSLTCYQLNALVFFILLQYLEKNGFASHGSDAIGRMGHLGHESTIWTHEIGCDH